MVSTLLEFVLLGAVAWGTAALVRRVTRRRAGQRLAELSESGRTAFPGRLSWAAGTGRKAFVTGRVLAAAGGPLVFSRWSGDTVELPPADAPRCEPSWRGGLATVHYAVPGRGEVRLLLSEKDAETVEGLLRAAGPLGD